MSTPIPGAGGKTRDLDGDTILDLSAIHGIMYKAADNLGLNSQDARVDGMENWLKAVKKEPQIWFDLVQRCNKSLLTYQEENKALIKDNKKLGRTVATSLSLLTADKHGDLPKLIQDMQDTLAAGLALLVAHPEDPQEVAEGDLVELIKELNDALNNRQGDINRLEDEAASNTQTENVEFPKLTSDFNKLSEQYNAISTRLTECRENLNNRTEERNAANEQGKKWQDGYHEHRTKLGELATRTQTTVAALNQTIAERDHAITERDHAITERDQEIEKLNDEVLVATTAMSQTQPMSAPSNFDHLFNAPPNQQSNMAPPPNHKPRTTERGHGSRGRGSRRNGNDPEDSSDSSHDERSRSRRLRREGNPPRRERAALTNERATPGASSSASNGERADKRWPDPVMFTGDDSSQYRKWASDMDAKLRNSYPDSDFTTQIDYFKSRTSDTAWTLIENHVGRQATDRWTSMDECWAEFDTNYLSKHEASQAKMQL
jgi:uncharacterized coiled-coil protein SlyX